MNTFNINTLGCKTNQLESAIIAEKFVNAGYKNVKFNDKADIYILNTCTVTSKTDNEAKYLIRKAKRINPESKIIVTGCFAQVGAEELEEIADVDLILGNSEKHNIVEIFQNYTYKTHVADIMQESRFINEYVSSSSGRTRANLKVQDGCNNRCAYCIIPFARGRSRSNSLDNIVSQLQTLVDKGYQEVILTGIHLGQWGLDLAPKQNFATLLRKIEQIDNLKRYRLGSLDPLELTDEVIEIIKKSEKFCKHLHISLQSATNKTLKNMRRAYKIEDYKDLVLKLASEIDGLAIGSDVIVGFPDETDEDFNMTYENLKELPISYLHVFPYSIRKGTPAAVMPNQVDVNVKKERANKLKQLANEKNNEFITSQLGKEQKVLVELKRDKKTGLLKGVSENYLTILIEGDDSLKNQVVTAQLYSCENNVCKGIII